MITLINSIRLCKWKYLSDQKSGIYYGIKWKYFGFLELHIEGDNCHFFSMKKGDEESFPRIRDRKDMSIRELIEKYIDEWHR